MKLYETLIPGVLVVEPAVYEDERGFFYESFNERAFRDATGVTIRFVQDNHSMSRKMVLRGLHYQLPPAAQGKLVRVVSGSIYDVAVDIRRSSPSFGEWVAVELSAENRKQIWIPEGFAHGFLSLEDRTEVLYKTTEFYSSEYDRAVRWNDPDLAIEWPLGAAEPILSEKDALAPLLEAADVFE